MIFSCCYLYKCLIVVNDTKFWQGVILTLSLQCKPVKPPDSGIRPDQQINLIISISTMVEVIEIHLLIHSIDRGMEENNSTSCKCNYWMYRHPRLEYLSKCILKLRVPNTCHHVFANFVFTWIFKPSLIFED